MENFLSSGGRAITGEFTGKMNEMKEAIKEGRECLTQPSCSEVMALGGDGVECNQCQRNLWDPRLFLFEGKGACQYNPRWNYHCLHNISNEDSGSLLRE